MALRVLRDGGKDDACENRIRFHALHKSQAKGK